MLNLYDDKGYVNVKGVMDLGLTFNYFLGPRGTGKTYTAFKELRALHNPFIYMRRIQTQLDECASEFGNPFKAINRDFHTVILPKAITKNSYGFYSTSIGENAKGEPKIEYGEEECTGIALSTFANLRGFDGCGYNWMFFDEIVPEPHQSRIKEEEKAFLNAYETINRNRELEGRQPLRVILSGNTDRLDAALINVFGMIPTVERMIRNDQEVYINRERSIGIFLLNHSPIADAKKNTALYKAISEDSDYYRMAIKNQFVDYAESTDIGSRPLNEYRCIAVVGQIAIYEHKSNDTYYVCKFISGDPTMYSGQRDDVARFRHDFSRVQLAFMRRDVTFDSYDTKFRFKTIYGY